MFISNAIAANGGAEASQGAVFGNVVMLLVFVVIFYFFVYKPQSDQAKKKQEIIKNIKKGDVIVCSSGIIGKVTKVHSDQIIFVEISDNVVVRIERDKIDEIIDKENYVKLK